MEKMKGQINTMLKTARLVPYGIPQGGSPAKKKMHLFRHCPNRGEGVGVVIGLPASTLLCVTR